MDNKSGNPSPISLSHRRMAVLLLTLAFCCLLLPQPPAHAQTPEPAYDEAEAQAIDEMLMCPVCPAESIDQAQVPLAKQMRQKVREMLAAGATRQEVLDYFADRYGQEVLASPPKSGLNLLAWILPPVGLLAGLAALLLVIRAMTGRRAEGDAANTTDAAPEENLEPYLAAVDRELELPGGGADSVNGENQGQPRRER